MPGWGQDSHEFIYPVKDKLARNYICTLFRTDRTKTIYPFQRHIPISAIKGSTHLVGGKHCLKLDEKLSRVLKSKKSILKTNFITFEDHNDYGQQSWYKSADLQLYLYFNFLSYFGAYGPNCFHFSLKLYFCHWNLSPKAFLIAKMGTKQVQRNIATSLIVFHT